jgi:2-methylcitrate dehydratase PrpD
VTASIDPDLGPGTDGSPARIRITFADGQVIEQYMEHSSGSRGKPMTQAQIDAKFLDCAAQVMPENAGRNILAAIKTFPERQSLDDFWPLLRKG